MASPDTLATSLLDLYTTVTTMAFDINIITLAFSPWTILGIQIYKYSYAGDITTGPPFAHFWFTCN